MTHLSAGSATDIGRRQINQDRVLVADDGQLFAVADGMGGHRRGEVAAQIAVTHLARRMVGDASLDALIAGVEGANREVFQASASDAELQGMGTTLTALALVHVDGEDRLAIANVGDSRTYLLRSGELEQLTEDHSLVAEMVREGHLTSEGARTHRQRSVLTKALGVEPSITPDVLEVLPSAGDRYLLCSDGLCGEVSDEQMAAVLRRLADPDEAARELVRLALVAGGSDNISVVVVDVLDDDGAAMRASAAIQPTVASDPMGRPMRDLDELPLTDDRADADAPTGTERRTSRRPRIVTWRVLLFVVALAAVAAVVVLTVRNTPKDQLPDASTSTLAPTTTDDPFGPTTSAGPTTSIGPTTSAGPKPTLGTGASTAAPAPPTT